MCSGALKPNKCLPGRRSATPKHRGELGRLSKATGRFRKGLGRFGATWDTWWIILVENVATFSSISSWVWDCAEKSGMRPVG